MSSLLAGFHPVREALRAGASLERVMVLKGPPSARLQEIVELCRERGIPVRLESRDALDRLARGATHQGVIALGAAGRYSNLEDVLETGGLLVILDGVEDPHNLGAILRTVHAAGGAAVIIPERRAAGLTETAAKAAAGALSLLPVVRASNVSRTLDRLKKAGYWIYGLDERGSHVYSDVPFDPRTALVFGGEGHGLHEQVRRRCDFLLRIPMAGQIASLNVSVAAGVVLFEWRRRREKR